LELRSLPSRYSVDPFLAALAHSPVPDSLSVLPRLTTDSSKEKNNEASITT
jgi:hypothetical protein